MLKRLQKAGTGFVILPIAGLDPVLSAWVASAGYLQVEESGYGQNGAQQGFSEFALFHHTFSGGGRLHFGNKKYDVGPGQAMLLHFPQEGMRYEITPGKNWEFIYLCLGGNEILRLWKELISRRGPLLAPGADVESLEAAAALYELLKGPGLRDSYESSHLAHQFVMKLYHDTETEKLPSNKPRWIHTIQSHLKNRLEQEISLSELAGIAGYSQDHFVKLFEAHTGETPSACLHRLRMLRAIELLKNKNLSIREVAGKCGFEDANYFARYFRKYYGRTPAEYKKSAL